MWAGRTIGAGAVLVITVLAPAPGSAQIQTGALHGVVTDTAGVPIKGVAVTMAGGSFARTAVTDADGHFQQAQMPPGRCIIKLELSGFVPQVRPADIQAGLDVVANFVMEVPVSPKPTQAADRPKTAETPTGKQARFWTEFAQTANQAFNGKLAAEGNAPLSAPLNFGAEFSSIDVAMPVVGARLTIPVVGVEFIGATSRTTHADPLSATTVIWTMPAVGVFVGPTIAIAFGNKNGRTFSQDWFYIHPAIGYYFIGRWSNASLTVSDRPGRLLVKGSAPGMFVTVGANWTIGERSGLFVEGGFRHVEFSDLEVQPQGDFPATAGGATVKAGSLSESLNYSGMIVRFGYGLHF